MGDDLHGWCISCDEIFDRESGTTVCPDCEGSHWVPYTEANETEDVSQLEDEFSGSKKVKHWDYKTLERTSPQPNVQELHLVTEDDWVYVFREPDPESGYELHHKRKPNGVTSDDDVVPVTVAEYIDEELVVASLNYAKLIVHPSSHVYEPPKE